MKLPGPPTSTQWTEVIEVIKNGGGEAAASAVAVFCERYHPVIVAFFSQRGCAIHDAQEYAQEFITDHILSRLDGRNSFLHRVDRDRTKRFRFFLFMVLKRFHFDKLREKSAQKAGGGAVHVPVEEWDLPAESEEARRIERQFDRTLAAEVFKKAAQRSVRSPYFLAFLLGEMDQREAAEKLGMRTESFKQRLFHFKKSLREDLRNEVKTLVGPNPADVEEEMRYLISLFAEFGL